ncbi:MAG: 23S rRNA pseudouridine(1911/1915/1917) synthase RluD [Burkholderiales bacterium]|nr:23S rRNA pseudouridine(1911/1915/1917) synthase RluD [Burkholderiales bacterium]
MSPAQSDATLPEHRLIVPVAAAGTRLDQALAKLLSQHSRSRLQAWIETGQVRVDGVVITVPRYRLRGGEMLRVIEAAAVHGGNAAAQPIPLSIVHEDATLLVVDKPAGLVVHPGSGNRDGTLLNALLHHLPPLAALPRAGIVHRLDKDTSGLMVVAKTPEAQTDLVRQLAARTVRREYVALVHGDLVRATIIDAPIGRHPRERTSMAVVATGKPARTHVDVVLRFGVATLLHCRLETGRTHQIRVHLTAIGHPLVGDPTYRGRRGANIAMPPTLRSFARQALHARRLGLVHPQSRATMQWDAPVPEDMAVLIDALHSAQSAGQVR